MSPTLRNNDVLYVKECAICDVSAGDVVIFIHPEMKAYVAHRIMSISAEGLQTRGDNNLDDDPYIVTKEMLIGLVESAFRSSRTVRVYRGKVGKAASRLCHASARCKYAWKISMEQVVRLKRRWS